ncbi:phage head spike fiber domain-containing protein [Atlantibacter hermannii]|uniref:phage head spike fiber domain-containing protein n=1 Tax=Atlantibacter hermannii TaxID=565 RepID=UPI0028A00F75|nr:LamG-like jellyroll fold domain-containing protein [Atlantibacter hermannii]
MSTIDIRRAAQYATVAENAAAQCVIVADNLQDNVEELTGQATDAAQQAVASQAAAKASETASKSSETSASVSAASAAQSAAEAASSAAATGYVAPPFPDVWAPLSDDLKMISGYPVNTKLLSFTRASTATYIDKSGVLQTAAINEPRFEKQGLLIEGSSTNLYLNSDNPANWATSGVTKTQQADGTTQAMTGILSVTADITELNMIRNAAPVALAVGESVSISCRTKATNGQLQVRVANGNGTGFVTNCTLDYLNGTVTPFTMMTVNKAVLDSDGYYTLSCTFTAAVSDNYYLQLRVRSREGQANIPAGTEIRLQMPQLETGALSTSYIPTSGSAATRAADDCYAQRSGNDNYFGPVTIAAEVHCNGQTATGGSASSPHGILAAYPTTNDNIILMVDSSVSTAGKYAFAYGSATFNYSDSRIDDGQVHTVCSRSTTLQNQSCVDGTQLTSPTTVSRPTPGTISSANQLIYIGRGAGATAAGQRMLNGHIRNLRIWHRALSDIQMKGIR